MCIGREGTGDRNGLLFGRGGDGLKSGAEFLVETLGLGADVADGGPVGGDLWRDPPASFGAFL